MDAHKNSPATDFTQIPPGRGEMQEKWLTRVKPYTQGKAKGARSVPELPLSRAKSFSSPGLQGLITASYYTSEFFTKQRQLL